MQIEGANSRQTDKTEIEELIIKQNQYIESIINYEVGWKAKILALAQVGELLIERDPTFNISISGISTWITHLLRDKNVTIADHVCDYLPDKYKNLNLARDFLKENGPQTWGGIEPSLLLEELAHLPEDVIRSLSSSLKIMYYDTLEKHEKIIENDAMNGNYQLNDKTLRKKIESREFPPRVSSLSNAIGYYINRLADFQDFVITVPPPNKEMDMKFADGMVSAAIIYEDFVNQKFSLAVSEWFHRDIYRVHQSKHGAAVKDKVMTFLCSKCSKTNKAKYDPNDFVEMEWDDTSPTHWRCGECYGTEGIMRGLTREQIGDRIAFMQTRAAYYVDTIPGYQEMLEYYNTLPQVVVYSRKVPLGVDLSSKA